MRAVIIATGQHPQLGALEGLRPAPLLRIVDKPILFHVLDWCIHQGADRIELVLHHCPEMIRTKVGDGSRWGVPIHYHVAKNADWPFGIVQSCANRWDDQHFFLGMGDHLPGGEFPSEATGTSLLMGPDGEWSGWALMQRSDFLTLPVGLTRAGLPAYFSHAKRYACAYAHLTTQSRASVIEANIQFLSKKTAPLDPPTSAREVEEGIWLCSNSVIHPTACIKAPVFIGRNTQIDEGTEIGPNVIIESNCIIDRGSHLESSLVCQNSYIGEDLTMQGSIIDQRWIFHTERETAIPISDDVILSELTPLSFGYKLLSLCECLMALGFLIALSPLFLGMALCCKLQQERVLELPSNTEEAHWSTFTLYSFIPRQIKVPKILCQAPILWNIAKGEVHFVGLEPRSPESVQKLPFDWRCLYVRSKLGWLTPVDVELEGANPSFDEIYITEVYYAAHDHPLYDLRLLGRWIKGLVQVAWDKIWG